METLPQLLATFFFGALLEGVILFVLDRAIGVRVYRAWYDFTHKTPLGKDVEMGFIHGQKADGRFTSAVLVALLQSGTAFWFGGVGIINTVIGAFVGVVGMMVGFYFGPVFNIFWDRRKPVLDAIDRLESHESTIGEEFGRAAEAVHERIAQDDPSEEAASVAASATHEETPVEPEVDPRDALDAFTRRSRS